MVVLFILAANILGEARGQQTVLGIAQKRPKEFGKTEFRMGTHPIDPFAGGLGSYVGAGSGRLVFEMGKYNQNK